MPNVNPKTLVVDVDDTISTHVNRDYVNAIPHLEMIAKLNRMYDAGWNIVYFTARGSISCDGDIERIERERRPVLETWLKEHGVKYHELRFGKPIGVYYIDDKALRPDEFMSMGHRVLKGGSGASVELLGNRVIKRAKNAVEQAKWYAECDEINARDQSDTKFPFRCTPIVFSAYGDIIEMEYIDGPSLNEFNVLPIMGYPSDKVWNYTFSLYLTIKGWSKISRPRPWQTMVDRVKASGAGFDYPDKEKFERYISTDFVRNYMEPRASFGHGDLTLENIIIKLHGGRNTGNMIFIDPNLPDDLYHSDIMDYGKLFQSMHFSYEENFGSGTNIHKNFIFHRFKQEIGTGMVYHFALMAEKIAYVRMLKYKTEEECAKIYKIMEALDREFVIPNVYE